MSVNIFMEGRIANDPEFKSVNDKGGFLRFRIASNRNYSRKGEEKQADFFNVSRWLKNESTLPNHLHKGKQVVIIGTLENDNYEKDGSMVYKDVIRANDITMVGSRGDSDSSSAAPNTSSDTSSSGSDGDLPF